MTTFFRPFLSWNLTLTRFLIGIYYGLLTTLPLAPSQLLSVRVLLLEDENQQGKAVGAGAARGIFIAGISGFLIAQLTIFCAIYSPSLYQFYFKPHFFNLLLPPLLIWHYFRIIEFDPVAHLIPNYKYSLLDPRVRTAFLESFLFQIVNPVVLPNPVFTRLLSVLLFRYSHIPVFVLGCLLGWLSGQILFFYLCYTLLSKLESDSPSIYRIVKRVIHLVFPPIIMGILLSYIGRVSMVPLPRKHSDMYHITKIAVWPDTIYNRNKLSRSTHFIFSPNQSKIRNQTNAPFNTLNIPLYKKHFSQFFFEKCLIDGQQRLVHNYPISLSIISRDIKNLVDLNDDNNNYITEQDWSLKKQHRFFSLDRILQNNRGTLAIETRNTFQKKLSSYDENNKKIANLSQYIKKKKIHSNELSQSIRKYINSFKLLNKRIRKSYDMRLGNSLRSQSKLLQDESFWFRNQKTRFSQMIVRDYLTRWKLSNQRLKRLKKIVSSLSIYRSQFYLSKKVPVWKRKMRSLFFYYEFEFFKKNLTRRRRRKFFIRSSVLGITSGRSRNINNNLFKVLDTKPRSSFFLRSNEIIFDVKDNSNSLQRLSQTASEKFDFSNSHSIRGPALITQAFIRKYIKLPLLIIVKSIIRLILLQVSEWDQDWRAWKNEKYLYCYYSGSYFSDDKLPPQWQGDGLQIKILFPLHITPWRLDTIFEDKNNPLLLQSSYINIWGQETDVPFGQIQSIPLLKPVIRGVILLTQKQLAKIIRIFYSIYFHLRPNYTNLINKFLLQQNQKISLSQDHQTLTTVDNILMQNSTLEYQAYNINKNLTHINEESINLHKNKFTYRDNEARNVVSLIKEPKILTNLNTKDTKLYSTFPHNLIIKNKKKFLEYQQLKLQIMFIDLNKKYNAIRKTLLRNINYVFFALRQKTCNFKKKFIQYSLDLIKLLTKYQIFMNRNLVTISMQNFSFDSQNLTSLKMKNLINKYQDQDSLSNAYILHKIWQMNVPDRIFIQKLLMEWNEERPLENYVKSILYQYGLVADKPMNNENFKEWLKKIKRYIPSTEIWEHISPSVWKNHIRDLYKNKNMDFDFSLDLKKRIVSESKKYLSYHKPLFESIHKLSKRWQTNLLITSYNNSSKSDILYHIVSASGNENHQYKQLFLWNIIKNSSDKKSKTRHADRSLDLHKKVNVHLTLSRPLINSMRFSSLYTKKWNTIRKQPLLFKYKNSLNLPIYNVHNFNKRFVFKPIFQYRWQSEQDRLKVLNTIDIIKKAKSDFKNTLQRKISSNNPNTVGYKALPGQLEQSSVQWKTLDLSKFTCQSIKKRQSKLLDDEILMHNTITSFLEFKKKYLYLKDLKLVNMHTDDFDIFNKDFTRHRFLIPEDLFLNKTLREYRILSSLNFQFDTSFKKDINLLAIEKSSKTFTRQLNTMNQYEIIKRYLWPSYKLEDLACFNRFLINTANQSRFSILRIKMYPDPLI